MKTPKREHSCIWCGGPLDVHLDPSRETEETSICRDCHRKTISHCGHTWEPYKERARWKRKNREARLRNKIKKEIRKHERDETKHKEFIRFINDSERLLHELAPISGAYGQDVEGS